MSELQSKIFQYLSKNSGTVFTAKEITVALFGPDYTHEQHNQVGISCFHLRRFNLIKCEHSNERYKSYWIDAPKKTLAQLVNTDLPPPLAEHQTHAGGSRAGSA